MTKTTGEAIAQDTAKHTPGPWEVNQGAITGTLLIGPRHGRVCRTLQRGPISEADARLIATAPELLAACQATLPFLETEDHRRIPGLGDCPLTAIVRAAIRKATGE